MKHNHSDYSTIALAIILAASSVRAQGTFVYDQQSSTNEVSNPFLGFVIQELVPLGQSFTPTLSSIGFIRLKLYDNTSGNGLGATLIINLRTNSITGTILASTLPVTLPDGSTNAVNFFFPVPVPLVPGTNYIFEPIVQAGDLWKIDAGPYNYPGGTVISQGIPIIGSDLWFREGVIVTEPSSALLILMAAAVLARQFRKRHRS